MDLSMYLISSAEIKSPSYASSSRRVLGIPPCFNTLGIGFWWLPLSFTNGLVSGFDTWNRKRAQTCSYRSFVGYSYTAICYLLWAYQTISPIQSNPIDQLLALWNSEVSHSSCCLFSACSRHFSRTAFGPFQKNVSVGFYRTWLTAVLCDRQNPGHLEGFIHSFGGVKQ